MNKKAGGRGGRGDDAGTSASPDWCASALCPTAGPTRDGRSSPARPHARPSPARLGAKDGGERHLRTAAAVLRPHPRRRDVRSSTDFRSDTGLEGRTDKWSWRLHRGRNCFQSTPSASRAQISRRSRLRYCDVIFSRLGKALYLLSRPHCEERRGFYPIGFEKSGTAPHALSVAWEGRMIERLHGERRRRPWCSISFIRGGLRSKMRGKKVGRANP